jgi:hypothetical protein
VEIAVGVEDQACNLSLTLSWDKEREPRRWRAELTSAWLEQALLAVFEAALLADRLGLRFLRAILPLGSVALVVTLR